MSRHRWPRLKRTAADWQEPELCANGCGAMRRYRHLTPTQGNPHGVDRLEFSLDGGQTWVHWQKSPPCNPTTAGAEEPKS